MDKIGIDPTLIDQIYEAAVIPELWADICDRLAQSVNSFSASVITLDGNQNYRWISSKHIHEAMDNFSRSPLRFANVRPMRHLNQAPFSYLRDSDVMTEEELESDPIYNEFMRPLGLGWTIGDVIQEPSGHLIVFDIIRQTDRGPFDLGDVATLNQLKPTLSRAALLSSRMAFKQAATITQALSLVGLPSVVVGDNGSVIGMNPEMEALHPRIRAGARNRISIGDSQANGLLQDALGQLGLGRLPSLHSIPVAADQEDSAMVLHLLPVKRNARDIFAKSAAVLVATPVGEVGPPDLRVICGLFDLTAGEARVAREIAVGTSVEDIAKKTGLTLQTVRTYLKLIFSKTGTSRQSQLTALLSGLGSPRL